MNDPRPSGPGDEDIDNSSLPFCSDGYHGDSEAYERTERTSTLGSEVTTHSSDVAPEPFPESEHLQQPHARDPELSFDAWGFPIPEDAGSELDPRGGWMPDRESAEATVGAGEIQPPNKEKQVNIRLDYARYSALAAAASLYGAPPTTFARMLVNRGVQAALSNHRAEFMHDPQD